MKQAAENISAPRLWLRLKPTHPCHMVDSPRVRRIFEFCMAVMTAGSSGTMRRGLRMSRNVYSACRAPNNP